MKLTIGQVKPTKRNDPAILQGMGKLARKAKATSMILACQVAEQILSPGGLVIDTKDVAWEKYDIQISLDPKKMGPDQRVWLTAKALFGNERVHVGVNSRSVTITWSLNTTAVDFTIMDGKRYIYTTTAGWENPKEIGHLHAREFLTSIYEEGTWERQSFNLNLFGDAPVDNVQAA